MAKRGRPRLNLAKRKMLQVRLLPDVKSEFERASQLAGKSLSCWVTDCLREAAAKEFEKNRAKSEDFG